MTERKMINGVDVHELGQVIDQISGDPELADMQFRVENHWSDGGRNQSTIAEFYGAKQENNDRSFTLRADEPPLLLGNDEAPNPVEHLLHALASCLTTSMVYHAAARGIAVNACKTRLSGELDLRGFLGLSDQVRRGYRRIDVRFDVDCDAGAEVLEQCARFSPVFDVVSNGTDVNLHIEQRSAAQAEPESGQRVAPR
jgi:uncharacterized OsmC-like protein